MKKFSIPCDFGGVKAPFDLYIGEPPEDEHPLRYQSLWLKEERGGIIPEQVFQSFHKLHELSKKNNVSFEDLCVYALESSNSDNKKNTKELEEKGIDIKKEDFPSKKFHVLADSNKLDQFFEDRFSLLYIACKNVQNAMCHSILLIREEQLGVLEKLWEDEDASIDSLNLLGRVEYFGKGIYLPEDAYRNLFLKYKPQKAAIGIELFELLKKSGLKYKDLFLHLLIDRERKTFWDVEKAEIQDLKNLYLWKTEKRLLSHRITKNPEDSSAYLSRGYVKLKLENYKEAINDFDQFLRLSQRSDAYDYRGFCKLKLLDFEGAYADIQKSIELDVNNSHAYKNMGKYYLSKDKPVESMKKLLKAKSLGYDEKFDQEVEQLIQEIIRAKMIF